MFDEANPAVQKHLEILQSIIDRMALNSSNCKTWCITIVSAILALAYQQNSTTISNLAYIPLLLFFFLDSYYLSIERNLRNEFGEFVTALHKGSLNKEQIYQLEIRSNFFHQIAQTLKTAFSSASILPFYGVFICLVIISTIVK